MNTAVDLYDIVRYRADSYQSSLPEYILMSRLIYMYSKCESKCPMKSCSIRRPARAAGLLIIRYC
jgi:hypothetical protein